MRPILLRAYDHRTQSWLTGKEAVPLMLTRSRSILASLIDRRKEYCAATNTPDHEVPRLVEELQREISILEKLL